MAVQKIGDLLEDGEVDLSNQPKSDDKVESPDELDLSGSSSTATKLPLSCSTQGNVWSNDDLKTIKPPLVAYVPQHILMMMRSIEARMSPSPLEFGAFLKGEWRDGALYLTEDFIVVRQKVSAVTIDFKEDPPAGYNGVIHRHPNGCQRFSGTDASSINENYMFSLLYVNNEITYGIINLELSDRTRLQIELTIKVLYPLATGMDEIIGKIEQENTTAIVPHGYRFQQGAFGNTGIPWGEGIDNSPGNPLVTDEDDEEEEVVYDLGQGYTYDGICVYDPAKNIMDEEDLPENLQMAYLIATRKEQERESSKG